MICMPEELRVYLIAKKITTGYELAALADECVITHKRSRNRIDMKSQNDCGLKGVREKQVNGRIKEENRNTLRREDKVIICYRCGKVGHIAAKCQTGRGQETGRIPPQGAVTTDIEIDVTYRPFVGKRLNIWTKEGGNTSNHIERYGSLPINSPKRKIATWGTKSREESRNSPM